MDPNLFHLDWERTLEVLAAITVLAFLVERVAALLLETKWFVLSTKVPAADSDQWEEEKLTEQACVAVLNAVPTGAEPGSLSPESREVLRKVASDIGPDCSLWPLDPTDPKKARSRAGTTLAQLRSRQDRRRALGRLPLKEATAFGLAAVVTTSANLDAFAIVMLTERTSQAGMLLTAAVVAGGAKASVKLFQDVMGVRSNTLSAVKPKRKDGE